MSEFLLNNIFFLNFTTGILINIQKIALNLFFFLLFNNLKKQKRLANNFPLT